MRNIELSSLRDHYEDLIRFLGFSQGYLPDAWQPLTAIEVDVYYKLQALEFRIKAEQERRAALPDYSNYTG